MEGDVMKCCRFCDSPGHSALACPRIMGVEFYQDGSVKNVILRGGSSAVEAIKRAMAWQASEVRGIHADDFCGRPGCKICDPAVRKGPEEKPPAGKVDKCVFCQDPDNPDPACHPGGDPFHVDPQTGAVSIRKRVPDPTEPHVVLGGEG